MQIVLELDHLFIRAHANQRERATHSVIWNAIAIQISNEEPVGAPEDIDMQLMFP
jgi:hypothetical protein